ncbi:MAG: DUF3141 domain-containing protein [Burkholderiales bacterium]|nr:DUF3141 domain-containing protein [Burkholderiales bacterium]
MTAAAAVKPKAKAATKTTRAPKPANAGIAAAAQAGVAPAVPVSLMEQALRYQIDRWQRSLMLLDTFRERANNMLAHETAGMPPPLHFEYETILDARLFERPANYALLRITRCEEDDAMDCVDASKPPVVIIDPRAGHGPGIGGFKHDSEVGMSLHEGHATYFVVFFPLPCPNQTLADVLHVLRRFVEEVSSRHDGMPPVLYGNCQAGWAATLLAADCEGLAGVTVLNGSPLSYWAGASDVNPMRLSGGLMGGSWMTHLLADLGDGKLDGAWLVQNFENLSPSNTLWDKNYNVFANIDTERQRFLDFEKWWTGYHFLSREEILSIVQDLFIGNKLERGTLKIDEHCFVDLKRIRNPLVIFASSGDNISPPHQALNWIPAVYPTTADLKKARQRIVYLLNPHVGHLGIFVSGNVAKLEHRAILESLADLNALKPGLYEMKISNPTGDPDCRKPQYTVRFEEREVEQIRYVYPQRSFEKVGAVSEWNEVVYQNTLRPWVTAFSNPLSAQVLKWLHPMRSSALMFSDKFNPWMLPLKLFAPFLAQGRMPAKQDNPFAAVEAHTSKLISQSLENYRSARDGASERLFSLLYGKD